jgi:hypothetical protein
MKVNYFYHQSIEQFELGKILTSTASTGSETFWGKTFGKYGLEVMERLKDIHNPNYSNSVSISHITELVFEWVRQKEYLECPSRLDCFFGHASLEDLKIWEKCKMPDTHYYTYKITSNKYVNVDAGWLNHSAMCWGDLVDNARKYWSNTPYEKPLPEVLLSLPVTVIEIVDI